MKLWRREVFDIEHNIIGDVDSLGVVRVVVSHRCGEPVPQSYRAIPIEEDQG
jgi:hypothetical protein